MANSAEDLEFNPFFKALQSQYYSLYDKAQQNCWLVCIPASASLQTCSINKHFTEKHLLQPSGLFRDVYESTNTSKLTWRLNGNELSTSGNGNGNSEYSVTVLAEELAYNKALKPFKLFITDKPLDPTYKAPEGLAKMVRMNTGPKAYVQERKKSYKEHREFLMSFHNRREGLEELNRQIRLFKQNYLVVEMESLLVDTAAKLEGMARLGHAAFLEANRQDPRLQDRRVMEACWLSMEGYLMHQVHPKVYPAICGVHAKYDKHFSERCQLLRGKLKPTAVGVSRDYECLYPSTVAHLRLIDSLETPLEILYTIQDAMDSIMVDVKDNFMRSLRIGEPSPLASDDLIAVLATILVQVDFKCLLSALYYVEHFHWSSDSDQLSYILVTFRAAVEYLRGSEVSKWLPAKSQQVKPQPPSFSTFNGVCERQGSMSPNQLLSTSEDSSSSGSGPVSSLSHTLDLLSQLQLTERKEQRPQQKPCASDHDQSQDSGLGPFLSGLLESDQVVSSDYYGK